jgi:hypothetical protein
MEVLADSLPDTVLYTDFLQKVMAGPHLTRKKSVRAMLAFNVAAISRAGAMRS